MKDYNLIPMGDNCIIAETLGHLGLRKCSYPFDWISHVNYFTATNISYNFETVDKLMKGTFRLEEFLGDALTEKHKTYKNMWFPHDDENSFEKYQRRFARLREDISSKKNIFLFLTRHYVMKEAAFDKIVAQVLSYHPENKIVFIFGSPHVYLQKDKYKKCVAYQHLEYDVSKLNKEMEYDYKYYRPTVKNYLATLFARIGYTIT
jgi:hypothetical protein